MKNWKLLLGFLLFMVVILTLTRTVISNSISTDGVFLGRIEEETNYYKNQNLIYKEKLYSLSSLNNISSQAGKLGFVDKKTGFVVGRSQPIAAR